jgi:hypothetical protein
MTRVAAYAPMHAPIGGCLDKKQRDLSFPFASISSKRDLNAVIMGCFLRHYSIGDQKEKWNSSVHDKQDMINRE